MELGLLIGRIEALLVFTPYCRLPWYIAVNRSLHWIPTLTVMGRGGNISARSSSRRRAILISASRSGHTERAGRIRHAKRINVRTPVNKGHAIPLVAGAGTRHR